MSLDKLQLCHVLAEPTLCPSVLITNTVQQIQEEMMTQDGTWQVLASVPECGAGASDPPHFHQDSASNSMGAAGGVPFA